MSEKETKQVWDNLYAKLNEEEKLFLAIVSNEKNKEIERLNKQIEEYQKALDETTSEKIDLENIIKEVREYIENNKENTYQTLDFEKNTSYNTALTLLLEILDKGE